MNNKIIQNITEFVVEHYNELQSVDKYSNFNLFVKENHIVINNVGEAIECMKLIDELKTVKLEHLKVALL